MKKSIVVLFSGSGTNFKNLIDKLHKQEFGNLQIEIAGAVTNNPNAKGINYAKDSDIPLVIIDHKDYSSREEFDKRLVTIIDMFSPDLVVMAGFMRIVTPVFTKAFRSINIHPSLLPLFKGANAIKDSFESVMKVGGVTVHWVTDELDGGPIILQKAIQKEDSDDLADFEAKIHSLEYDLLPRAVLKVI